MMPREGDEGDLPSLPLPWARHQRPSIKTKRSELFHRDTLGPTPYVTRSHLGPALAAAPTALRGPAALALPILLPLPHTPALRPRRRPPPARSPHSRSLRRPPRHRHPPSAACLDELLSERFHPPTSARVPLDRFPSRSFSLPSPSASTTTSPCIAHSPAPTNTPPSQPPMSWLTSLFSSSSTATPSSAHSTAPTPISGPSRFVHGRTKSKGRAAAAAASALRSTSDAFSLPGGRPYDGQSPSSVSLGVGAFGGEGSRPASPALPTNAFLPVSSLSSAYCISLSDHSPKTIMVWERGGFCLACSCCLSQVKYPSFPRERAQPSEMSQAGTLPTLVCRSSACFSLATACSCCPLAS